MGGCAGKDLLCLYHGEQEKRYSVHRVTNDLIRRVYEHKQDFVAGFTRTYRTHTLVYFEEAGDVDAALNREKQLKKWLRKWKLALIEEHNPEWKDLWVEIVQ